MTHGAQEPLETQIKGQNGTGTFVSNIMRELIEELLHQRRRSTSDTQEIEIRDQSDDAGASKEHIEDFMDLDDKLMLPVMRSVQKVAKMIEKALGADNFTIGVNSGKIVGRHVEHVHVHVIPRFPDDEGHYIQGVVNRPSKETLEEIKKKIVKDGN